MLVIKLGNFEPVDSQTVEALAAVGIFTTERLRTASLTGEARRDLAAQSGVGEARLLALAHRIDLMRVDGVGSSNAALLIAGGVPSVEQLAGEEPNHLAATLAEVNAQQQLCRLTPTLRRVTYWVRCASKLGGTVQGVALERTL